MFRCIRSPAGLRYCRTSGELPVTDSVSQRLIRLPLWMGISYEQQVRVVKTLIGAIKDELYRGDPASSKGASVLSTSFQSR